MGHVLPGPLSIETAWAAASRATISRGTCSCHTESMVFSPRKIELPWRSLHGSAWQQFVAEVFRRKGYWVKEAEGGVTDGIDLIATYDDERLGIQCRGGVESVNSEAVQQVLAGKAVHKCNRVAVVTNSGFTKEAIQLGEASDCWLVDAGEFAQLAGDRQPVVSSKRPSLFARVCMGFWALLVRLFGMTVALVVLVLGVAAIALVLFFLFRSLPLTNPPHQPVEVPELPPAHPPTDVSVDDTIEVPAAEAPAGGDDPISPVPAESSRYQPDRAASAEKPRVWSSADGQFSQRAVYLGFEAGQVKLRRTDTGEVIRVDLDDLSELDKKIVTARIQAARFEELQQRRNERAAEAAEEP